MFCRTFALAAVFCFVHAAHATEPPALTLFENVRIFDGKTETLSASMNVLVRGNTIEKISNDPIPIDWARSGTCWRSSYAAVLVPSLTAHCWRVRWIARAGTGRLK
jgi:hypothetical protein